MSKETPNRDKGVKRRKQQNRYQKNKNRNEWSSNSEIQPGYDTVEKSRTYQQLALVEVNLIFKITWVAKKDGFVFIWHNDLRDITANIMSEVCKDAEFEPELTPLSGEELHGKS